MEEAKVAKATTTIRGDSFILDVPNKHMRITRPIDIMSLRDDLKKAGHVNLVEFEGRGRDYVLWLNENLTVINRHAIESIEKDGTKYDFVTEKPGKDKKI
jgi:hypothetical protein